MSIEAMTWAFTKAIVGDAGAKLVLLAIADHADDDGYNAFPSLMTIGRKAELSRSSVKRAIKHLEARGLLKVEPRFEKGRQTSSAYTLAMVGGGVQSDTLPLGEGSNSRTGGGVHSYEPHEGSTVEPQNLPNNRPSEQDAPNGANGHKIESTSSSSPHTTETQKTALYRIGEQVLGRGSGGLVTKLLTVKDGNIDLAMAALYQARAAHNARQYIGGIIKKQKPEERTGAIL